MSKADMSKAVHQPVTMYYPWQKTQWQQLSLQIEQKRLPHALNLVGSRHIGKHQFALSLAQSILCLEPVGRYACGQCKSCYLVSSGNHPDLFKIEPEEQGKTIRIDRIRELGDFVAKTSQQGGWKVAIIHPAESMNINAANALLKNLEEPAAQTLLLLVSHEPARLSATIRSRCRMVKFPVPAASEVLPWLAQVAGQQEDMKELLQYANGRPLLALQLLETDLLERRRKFEGLIMDLAAQRVSALNVAEACQANDPEVALDWLYSLLVAEAKDSYSGSNNISQRLLFRYMDRLVQAKRLTQSTANPNLLLLWEELLLNWQQLFATRYPKKS
jgi:DNA polymerase-3 subunit delta'